MLFFFVVLTMAVNYVPVRPSNAPWVSCTLKEQPILQNSSIARVSGALASLEVCAALASSLHWPQLFCYGKDEAKGALMCTVWPLEAVPVGDVVREPSTEATTCMTMIPDSRSYPPVPRCPKPFYMTSVGCLFVDHTPRDWPSARLSCQAFGGDLFIAEDVQEFDDLRAHLMQYYGKSYAQLWVGVERINMSWLWLSGRPVTDQECSNCGSGGYCARTKRHREHSLYDISCSKLYGQVCQRRYI